MTHALRKTHDAGFVPAIPTSRETALFLLAPSRGLPELAQEWDEEDGLTFVKYYSPTSD